MRLLYSLLISLISPVFFLRLLYRSIWNSDYRRRWSERLAVYRGKAETGVIWFHAVSFGEAEAVFPLILEIRNSYPAYPILVTTTTITGSDRVRSVLGDTVQHVYLPFDLPGAGQRFLRRFKPVLGVLMETEIWPNLYRACGGERIPLAIINGRLSERSARGYGRLRRFTTDTLQHVSMIAAQTSDDGQRFVEIGARPETISVMGNIKFDYRVPEGLAEMGATLRRELFGSRPVWIAASTHKGEEEQVLDALESVRSIVRDLILVLVPRHPERFSGVASLCEQRGFELVRRSEDRACSGSTSVFLLDAMGELKQFYAMADLAYIGGSLVKKGGQNPLEACALGVPTVFGPHMFNFRKIGASLVEVGAAIQVADSKALGLQCIRLLKDTGYRASIGEAGRTFVENNRGAVHKVVDLLGSHL